MQAGYTQGCLMLHGAEDKLWVHGGMSNFVLDDTFVLDLESGIASRLQLLCLCYQVTLSRLTF